LFSISQATLPEAAGSSVARRACCAPALASRHAAFGYQCSTLAPYLSSHSAPRNARRLCSSITPPRRAACCAASAPNARLAYFSRHQHHQLRARRHYDRLRISCMRKTLCVVHWFIGSHGCLCRQTGRSIRSSCSRTLSDWTTIWTQTFGWDCAGRWCCAYLLTFTFQQTTFAYEQLSAQAWQRQALSSDTHLCEEEAFVNLSVMGCASEQDA